MSPTKTGWNRVVPATNSGVRKSPSSFIFGIPSKNSGNTGTSRTMDAKRLKKSSSGPNTRLGPEDGGAGERLPDGGFARRLGARIRGRRGGIGADRRDVEQVRGAGIRRCPGDAIGRCDVDGVEVLPAALVKDAGEIDDGVGPGHGAADRGLVPHVGLDRDDLADIAAGGVEIRRAPAAGSRRGCRSPPAPAAGRYDGRGTRSRRRS